MTVVLVLGATGMLGHKVWQTCDARTDTWATVRGRIAGIPDGERVIDGVGGADAIERALERSQADVVINCIGVIKQLAEADDPLVAIPVNSLLPHQIAAACNRQAARLIHVSTDCVFSGRVGNYTEDDLPDPPDLYGASKLLGEVRDTGALTVRTSIIGRELKGRRGLLEWFLAQRGGTVSGFTRARFSGVTTNVLAELLADVAVGQVAVDDGLWHVSADPITKHDLLLLARDEFDLDVEIVADDRVAIDRTLDSSRFRVATGWSPPAWADQLAALAADPTPYDAVAAAARDAH